MYTGHFSSLIRNTMYYILQCPHTPGPVLTRGSSRGADVSSCARVCHPSRACDPSSHHWPLDPEAPLELTELADPGLIAYVGSANEGGLKSVRFCPLS